MRFFTASPKLLDQIRDIVILQLEMPNIYADEPWQKGASAIALGSHHYQPDEYASLLETALSMGVVEITEDEYMLIRPEPIFTSSQVSINNEIDNIDSINYNN